MSKVADDLTTGALHKNTLRYTQISHDKCV